ncbi:ABC transporter ATP-binding protein [Arcanobacterium haemolyticum]|nr:ABC transporter ATP-binding protein [Arcanobacterium haemolyticum]
MSALSFAQVTRTFGKTIALDDVSFNVEEGSICALLGPNGAGKTTALRILLGLARSDSGTVRVLGAQPGSLHVRRNIGYLPDVPSFPAWMSAAQYLTACAELENVSSRAARSRIAALLEAIGLAGNQEPVRTYSRGMRQILGFAQALMSSPRLLVLDEPTSALDPRHAHDVIDIIRQCAAHSTVLISSHNLAEVQTLCTHAVVLNRGRVLTSAPITALRTQSEPQLRIESPAATELSAAIKAESWCSHVSISDGNLHVRTHDEAAAAHRIPEIAAALHAPINAIIPEEPSLEDVFLRLTSEESHS